jgi:hypothetical protein
MKNHRSIRYAFVWCEQLASSDIEMGALDLSMQQLYRKYAAAARHLGGVVEFDTWVEIFSRVLDKQDELEPDFDFRGPWLH